MPELRVVGIQEAAHMAGIRPATLSNYMRRNQANVPEPDAFLACGPVWRTERIERWCKTRPQRPARDLTGEQAMARMFPQEVLQKLQ